MRPSVGINLRDVPESDVGRALSYIWEHFNQIRIFGSAYFCGMPKRYMDFFASPPQPQLTNKYLMERFYVERGIQDSNPKIKLKSLMDAFDIPSIDYLLV